MLPLQCFLLSRSVRTLHVNENICFALSIFLRVVNVLVFFPLCCHSMWKVWVGGKPPVRAWTATSCRCCWVNSWICPWCWNRVQASGCFYPGSHISCMLLVTLRGTCLLFMADLGESLYCNSAQMIRKLPRDGKQQREGESRGLGEMMS